MDSGWILSRLKTTSPAKKTLHGDSSITTRHFNNSNTGFLGICRWQPHTHVRGIRRRYLAGQRRRSPASNMKNVIVECAQVYNSWVISALQPPQITQQRKSWKEAPPWFPQGIPPLLSGAWQVKVRIKRFLKNPTYIESTYSFHWSFFLSILSPEQV